MKGVWVRLNLNDAFWPTCRREEAIECLYDDVEKSWQLLPSKGGPSELPEGCEDLD